MTPWTHRKPRSPSTAGRSATNSLPQLSRAFPGRRAQRKKRPRSFITGISTYPPKAPKGPTPQPHSGLGEIQAMDAVAMGQGDGLQVHHLQQAFSPGKTHREVGK